MRSRKKLGMATAIFYSFFLKVKILVYEIKAKLSVKIYHSVSCHGLGKQIFFTFSKKLDIVSNDFKKFK